MNTRLAGLAGTAVAMAIIAAGYAGNAAPAAASQASIVGEWRCSAAAGKDAAFKSSATFRDDGAMKTIDDVTLTDNGHLVKIRRSITGKWQVRDQLLIIDGAREEVISASADGDTRYTTVFRDMRAQKPMPKTGVRLIKALDASTLVYGGDEGVVTCARVRPD